MKWSLWLPLIVCSPASEPAEVRQTVARVGPAALVTAAPLGDGVIQFDVTRPLTFAIVIDSETGLEVTMPSPVTMSPGWSLLHIRTPTVTGQAGQRVRWQQEFVLDALLPLGPHTLTLAPLRYRVPPGDWQEIAWPPLAVEVVPPRMNPGELRDITAIEELPVPPSIWQHSYWLALGATCFVGMVLAVTLCMRLRRRTCASMSPTNRALHELARIRALDLHAAGAAVRFHGLLANVVRNFLENRFGLQARRRTTEELRAEVASHTMFSSEQKNELLGFLDACDRAKFAGVQPCPEECTKQLTWVTDFVQHFQQQETTP